MLDTKNQKSGSRNLSQKKIWDLPLKFGQN